MPTSNNNNVRLCAKRFHAMLKYKRAQMTEGEFRAWYNKHHTRTDPYSYRGSDIKSQWQQTAPIRSLFPSKRKHAAQRHSKPTPKIIASRRHSQTKRRRKTLYPSASIFGSSALTTHPQSKRRRTTTSQNTSTQTHQTFEPKPPRTMASKEKPPRIFKPKSPAPSRRISNQPILFQSINQPPPRIARYARPNRNPHHPATSAWIKSLRS